MRTILYTLILFTLFSCSDNCDISHYPSAPFINEPYHAEYGDHSVKYIYLCRNGNNNEVYNYYIDSGCWEYYVSYQYNYNCN